jgi:hypothetical protein
MIKTFPLDFVRVALEQTLLEQHIENNYFFGGDDQVKITSYYEQLANQDEVNRFVETFRDLADQQNRTGLIGNGVILTSENPTITNLYTAMIIPLTWTCHIRVNLSNRDQMVDTLFNLISQLKGSKVDVGELKCPNILGGYSYKPFAVGTIGHNEDSPLINNGDYIGELATDSDLNSFINGRITTLLSSAIGLGGETDYLYFDTIDANNKKHLKVAKYVNNEWVEVTDENANTNIIFPPEHDSYERFKVSLSFESIRVDNPRTLNGEEYCEISFGGSATIVNEKVKLGNDLVKVGIKKLKIVAEVPVNFNNLSYQWLEPMEMPSSNNGNTIPNQLTSNFFKVNSHTDSTTLQLQYSFVLDEDIDLLNEWFDYARYGTYGITSSEVSPNMIYNVKEIWSSWGNVKVVELKTKLIESVTIENTESDVLTIGVNMQIQGDNN